MAQQQPSSGWQGPPPEPGPAPGVAFAGFGARLVAYIIDVIVVGVVTSVIVLVGVAVALAGAINDSAGVAVIGALFIALAVIVVMLAYFPWFWARSGATPGMQAMGIMVVRDADGGPVSGSQAVLRLIGYWVSGAVFYLGYIWIFVDPRRRGWHDLIAGTVVIRTP